MSEKKYEECAKKVRMIIHQHRQEAEDIGQALQKINADPRYSQMGKDELVGQLRIELKELNKTKTEELKAVVTEFCKEYQVVHTDDGKSNSQEIANALKVIEMCGYGLTSDLLRSVVEPLKGSYTTLKMIRSLLAMKNDNAGLGYSADVLILMDEYIGVNAEIITYEDRFESVKEVLDMPELVSIGIYGEPEFNGAVINRLRDETHYSVLTLSDNMMKVGELHNSVYLEYPRLFK